MNDDRVTEDQLYRQYQDELSGEAARRRSIENARKEQREREEDWRAWAEQTGSPLPIDLQ
ncbi:MAG: hypothetical protein M3P49_14475 [Actinomycetota bacterium]|jgi:hypothetical protein|nr:hypothetical protein [Actinomycetota bacterium]